MMIVMAGLPGTGKSTLARALAQRLHAIVLNKDEVRAALFPPETIEYSMEQDDLCIAVMLQVASFLLRRHPDRPVILDGRTFMHLTQVEVVVQAAARDDLRPIFIECTCSETVALQRLRRDRLQGAHPADNRDGELYRRIKATAEPLDVPHVTVNTEQPIEACVAACLAHLDVTLPSAFPAES